jgi:flavodoxin
MKALIIYYSLSNNTQQIAKEIATAYNVDIERIQEPRIRAGVLGTLRKVYEILFTRRSKIADIQVDPCQYDLLILVTPV